MGVKQSFKKQLVIASTTLMAYFSTPVGATLNTLDVADSAEKQTRIPTEELIEGIKSADGRWFDVEIILFERTRESDTRERFEQTITNKKPRYGWDVQADVLTPDIAPLLYNLPQCYAELNPLSTDKSDTTDNEQTPKDAPNVFFERYVQYQQLITEDWQASPNLCLLPSEKLDFYWQLVNSVSYLPVEQQVYTFVPYQRFPKQPTGRDYDDYRGVYLLADENLELKQQANKLDKHWNTRVLLHMGWRQPGLSPKNAVKMYIRAGTNFTDQFNYDGTAKLDSESFSQNLPEPNDSIDPSSDTNSADPATVLRSSNQQAINRLMAQLEAGAVIDPKTQTIKMPNQDQFPADVWQLDGTIKVILDHYLYLDADLNFRELSKKPIDIEQLLGNQVGNSVTLPTNSLTSSGQNVLISAAQKDKQVSEFNEFKDGQIESTTPPPLLEVEYLQNFPFKQLRRTYSGDLHYLDHPKFGVLFQIRKYRH